MKNHGLDKKDTAIIKELDFNARMSISALARKVRVSKEVANYRLKKLMDQKIIKSFNAIIDPYALGYQMYSFRIKFRQSSDVKKKEMLNWFDTHGNFARIIHLGGKWDVVVFFWARNPTEFSKVYDYIINKFGSIILKKTISIIISIEHRAYNFLYENFSDESLTIGFVNNKHIDQKDYIILDLLSKDGRIPLLDIAKKTKLTANAVKYRLKNLEKEKIIKGYSLVLNNYFFNLTTYRVTLYLSDPSKKKEAKEFLRRQKEVVMITELLGLGDVRFEMLCSSALRIYDMIAELNKQKQDIVRDFDESIILAEEFIDYFPNE